MKIKSHLSVNKKRIVLVKLLFCLATIIITARLFSLQIIKHNYFVAQAENIRETKRILESKRGLIYCQDKNKNLIPVAINKKYYYVYAVPKEIENPALVTEKLINILPVNKDVIFSRLSKTNDPYEPIYRRIDDQEIITKIKSLEIKGVYLDEEYHRYYPLKDFAAQVIGFLSDSEKGEVKGRYGLESYYNDILAGEAGIFYGVKDSFGRLIRSVFSQEKNVLDGVSLILTIDKNIQSVSERALENLVKGRKADGGSLIVMEAKTGKILALANWPTFNLNEYFQEKDWSVFRNSAVENRYELGSVLKTFILAVGLDTNKITPDTTYLDKGFYNVDGFRITNYKNEVYGKTTMRRVLERSINTGAIFIQKEVGGEVMREYYKKFGFAEKSGIDLPNEITGDLSNLEFPKSRPSHFATASFGYGIPITLISLLRAHTPFLNNGKMVTPYIVESVIDNNGNRQQQLPLSETKQIINPQTAETITTLMVSVIENGFGGNAKIKGYSMGGKTGTAFIPLKDKLGYSEDEIHTFVGFFPASNPTFLIAVKLDRPQAGGAAAHTVTLAFREVKKFLINYYNIPPDEKI